MIAALSEHITLRATALMDRKTSIAAINRGLSVRQATCMNKRNGETL